LFRRGNSLFGECLLYGFQADPEAFPGDGIQGLSRTGEMDGGLLMFV
jgi:hypothetical protein